MKNNNLTGKWNLSKKWTYIRDMKKNPYAQLKDYTESLSQNPHTFLSRMVVVSVLIFGNLIVCLLFLLIYLVML
ncbi:MAG: hypothetical protein H7Y13_10425 [Sphingobacteriaceae bacterium]|nr:hypothetical protein [Sphingobacteriaceae bacterium]